MCMQGHEMLLHGCLLAMPKTAPRTTVNCAEILLEQQCKQTLTCCKPHCTARNHLGWAQGGSIMGFSHVPMSVCPPLAFLQAAE